jgi:predicted nucleotidyltransferase
MPEVKMHKIIEVIVGSRAYGFNTSSSDVDITVITMPTTLDIARSTIVRSNPFLKSEQVIDKEKGVDTLIIPLPHLISTLLKGSLNAVEVMVMSEYNDKTNELYLQTFWDSIRDDLWSIAFSENNAKAIYGFASRQEKDLHSEDSVVQRKAFCHVLKAYVLTNYLVSVFWGESALAHVQHLLEVYDDQETSHKKQEFALFYYAKFLEGMFGMRTVIANVDKSSMEIGLSIVTKMLEYQYN